MSNRYQQSLAKKGSPLFIPFSVVGDPNRETSEEVIMTLVESGADALELGLPFSDPPADGPTIQAADARALEAGVTTDDCFTILASVRAKTDILIGLLVYYNLVLQRGIEKFYSDCAEAGVDSVLIADLPLDHIEEVTLAAKSAGVAPVMLVSELTSDDRLEKIAKVADGYLYVVSYVGITGVEDAVLESKLKGLLTKIRSYTDLPLCVGFGINTPEQARAVVDAGADGVIVGSRIVKEIPNTESISSLCREFSDSCNT